MSTVQETAVLAKIRSRGHWRVVIRPTEFQEHRVSEYADLWTIVEKNSVRLRGWDYPHIDRSQPPLTGNEWVGQEYDQEDEIELWRIYQSGLFIHFFTIAGDWRDLSTFWPAGPEWAWGREVDYLQTIYSFLEIFEFASRLALSPAGAGLMNVGIDMERLMGRRVATTDDDFTMSREYKTAATRWAHRWQGTQTDLIGRPRELAASAAREFFARFGLEVSMATLLKLQQRVAP
jgi:hypothetical protein